MDNKESTRESRDRSRSDHSSKSRESSQSGSRSESREKPSKSSKSEHLSKSKSKSESPEKKSKQDGSQSSDKSRQNTSPGEPEHKEPIKLKLSLSQIRAYASDDSDSATSYEDYEETRKRTKSRKEGSSKKKKSKDKSKKSKSSTVDPDSLAPPELELMETGERTQISDAEASLLTDPEPLSLLGEETMDLPPESLNPGSCYQDSEDTESQQMPGRICAFCACGERSLLGQGDMDRYDPTPGYNAFKKTVQKTLKKISQEVEERGTDKGAKPLTQRRNRTSLKTRDDLKSPRQTSDDQCEGFDELATVGYPEDTDVATVIETSGHTWAHHCCAAWSEGVLQTEDFNLQYVDKAVVMGLSKRCSYCLRYGATINCRYSKCNKIFHYPCASAGGCFQDIRSLSLLCPDHTDEAQTIAGEEALCVVCNIVGNIHEQLFCTSCGHHYHGNCLHPPVEVNPIVRAGWQCPDCKICQMCRQPGDDSKMLVCDMCDKGYHTFCLKPVMTTIPKNGWKCKNCRVCEDCGSRTPGSGKSSRWHLNYTVCDSCYQQRNKGLSCPLCGKAYRHFSQKAMVQCNLCKKLVHSECDDTIDSVLLQQVKNEEPTDYMCTICRNRDPEMDMPDFPIGMIEDSSDSLMMQKTAGLSSSEIIDEYGEDSQPASDFMLNEDSLSSMDLDLNILEKMSPTYTMPGREGEGAHGKGKLVAMARKKMNLIAAKTNKMRQLAPEKRKRPLTFGEKRNRPKPKIGVGMPGVSRTKQNSTDPDDDDDDHPNTLVLARKDDNYTLCQDICKSCGSFGQGDEGRLIVCTQCGQCYHPYCANIKVTKIVIQKGWRCIDCTICEGCGQPHDEGRLLLCDECDISYHTYCLDPPLDHVPKGTWKCKWCVICLICGSTNPGYGCQWQRNYTHCGPCHSKISCPVCRMRYHEDELIIQCVQCDRWLHAFCDGIHNEDDAERAADFGYQCLFCRPRTGQPGPLPPPPQPPTPPLVDKFLPLPLSFPPPTPKELEPPRYYLVDGVLLSTTGRNLIENIKLEAPKIKRNRRWGKKPEGWDDKRGEIERKMEEIMAERVSQDSESASVAPTISRMLSIGSADDEEKESEDFKSPDEGGPDSDLSQIPTDAGLKPPLDPAALALNLELQAKALLAEEKKMKKKRNVSRLGVGGFVVKPRIKPRAKRQQSLLSEELEGLPRPLEGEEGFPGMPVVEDEKPRKRRQGLGPGRRKSQLQENFPSYMQEAFFGREILDRSKDMPYEGLKAMDSDEDKSRAETPKSLEVKEESKIAINSEQILKQISEKQKQAAESAASRPARRAQTPVPTEQGNNEEPDLELDDLGLDIEEDFLKMFGDEILHEEMETEADDNKPKDRQAESDIPDLPHLEKNMDIESILSDGLAHIDSKTVEDIFKGVWQGPEGQVEAPAAQPQPQPPQPPQPLPAQHPQHPLHPQHPPEVNYPVPMPPSSHPGPEHQLPQHHPYPPQFPTEHMGGQPPPPFDPNFPATWPQAMTEDNTREDSSRRNMLKWESDEDLGPDATISPILYCNLEHPELKQQYPDWQERSKQIAKIWRKLSADEKQPYLIKARKNRGTYKAKQQAKVTPEQRRKKPETVLGPMGMHPGDVFPSPDGPPGMQSPMHPSPGGMQSPLRPGGPPMMPGTPEGQSPSHSISGMSESPVHPVPLPGFGGPEHPFQKQGSVDGYGHMPPSSRPQDPYSMPPPTPRGPMGDQYPQTPGTPRADQFGHSPNAPYNQSPVTPRSAEHTPPHDPYRSPVKDPYMHSPGMEHFMPRSQPQQGPRPPLQHHPSWPQGPESDPYERQPQTPFSAPATPRPMGPQAGPGLRQPHPLGPRFMRQRSEPGTVAMGEDPYAFPPGTPGIEGAPHHLPPGTPQPVRMPERQMSMPVDGQMPPTSMGHFRHPFRPPGPHTMRLPTTPQDPYGQQPATPRPGMEQPGEMHPGLRPPEPSALQQMYAAANRRQIFPPVSRMWPLPLAQTLATGAQSDIQKQQLREILAQQTKQNLQKKKEQQGAEMFPQDGNFTEPRPPGMPGARMPMMPPGSQAVTPAGPGQPQMMFPRGMRPPFDMRPPGELTPEERKTVLEYFKQKVKEQAAHYGHIPPGQHQPPGAHATGVPEAGTQPGDEGAGTSKEESGKQPEGRMDGRVPKPSVSSEEEKADDADELGDFLGEDGTFDILKYADPDLDLGGDNKTIFDDLVYDAKEQQKKDDNKDLKTEEKPLGDEGDLKTEDGEKSGPVSEFQAKFLEFSQRKPAGAGKDADVDTKKGGRPQSVKSEGAEGMDTHTPTTPGTPMTPMGQDPNAMLAARAQGQFATGVQSPAHPGLYPGQNSAQPSPAGSGFGQPASGLPSPKVQPSPKSQPSPRTPGDSSMGQQHSPFSQHTSTQSPFSPNAGAGQSPYAGTPTSAPQSPFAGMKPQSPFAVPGSSGAQQQMPPHMSQGSPLPTSYSPGHTPPAAFPMQRSPRAAMPPGNQYVPGSYPQSPYGPGVAPRASLTPSPGAVSYGKPGMRPQGPPASVAGIQPPVSGPMVQQPSPGQQPGRDLNSPGLRPQMPGMRPQFPPGHPGAPPVSPGQQMGMYPQRPGVPGQPGQQMPQFAGQPGMTRPPTSVSAIATSTSMATGQRPPLLEEQPLLIQDLLEQEKQEQQKRQAEQQAMMHRRDAGPGVHPERMVGPRPGMPPPGMVPRMEGPVPRMEGPVRHQGQPGMFIPPEMAAYRPRVPGQLSPRPPGPQPGMMGMQPGAMRMPGPPQMQQPPKPPTPGETGPEAEQQHILYDTWLVRQGEFLEGQVKFLEQQIQKQKRTKKAINARNRQAKKNGQEMPQQDAMEFERASQELAIYQKQLEQARKQNRQHQMVAQEYRSKQQEHFTQQMAAQAQIPQMIGPQTSATSVPQSSTPASTPMQPPPPRMPGAQGSVRLTPSARQEYEAYMQNRLRMMGPQGMTAGPRMPGPPPGVMGPGQPRMAIGDNNPFSEEFQEREQMEKLRESQGKQMPPTGPLGEKPADDAPEPGMPRPPFADPRFPGQPGPTTQAQRFPGPPDQQPWMHGRFPFDPSTGQRMPGPGDPRFAGPFMPGHPAQMPPHSQGLSYPSEMSHPPSVTQPMDSVGVTETKEKTKKRKKKKKAENSQTPPTSQPPTGKPPPIQFKPHDETERRIMEILNSTANLQRGQSPGSTLPPVTSVPQTSQSPSIGAGDSSSQPVAMATSDNSQPNEVVPGQPIGQAGSPAVLQAAKTPPVQGRMTPGQTARSPASLSARSPATQQGRQTPGAGPQLLQQRPQTPGMVSRPQTPGSVTQPGRQTPGAMGGAPVAQQGRQTPGAAGSSPAVSQQGPQTPGSVAGSPATPSGPPQPSDAQQPGPHPPLSGPQATAAPPVLHPAPPSLQHAPSSLPQSTVATVTGPPSLQAAPHVRPPMSVPQSVAGLPGMQQGPQGIPVSMPGLPPGHPLQNHPGFPRHLIPGMMQQRPEQGFSMMQRPGFPPMEHMQGMMTRPPMLPHWSAPRQEFPTSGGPARRSPRPALPSMTALARMGMPHLSMRQGAPHLSGGPFPTAPSSMPVTSGEGIPVTAVPQEDPSRATIPAGIPRSSPENTSVGPVSNVPMQTQSNTEQAVENEAIESKGKSDKDSVTSEVGTASASTDQVSQEGKTDSDAKNQEESGEFKDGNQKETKECTDGVHCGTPPPQECTDGKHCGTPPPQECTDGIHCGTPPPQECTDGRHCGTPPPQECTDGIHCGTPPPQECTDGIHCGTPPPQECTDGIHCGTPPPQECTDGIHCGTPPPQECTDGIHCETPPPQECTDGIHCGTPPPQECTDGIHCGTPPPQECTDGIHCGTPPPQECTDGIHCGTPPPQECTDGVHCGTPPPQECTDGVHCGTPPPQECADGVHCGTPPPQECTDGIHCGTPPPQECTDGIHCGTPPPQECTDGIHCGTPPPQECTDGIHCGTPPPQECTDGVHCGTPPPQECTDGVHCGTPPPQEQVENESQQQQSTEQPQNPPQPSISSSLEQQIQVVTQHDAPPSLQPAMLSPQQLAVQVDHQYVNVSQPPVLLPSHSTEHESVENSSVTATPSTSSQDFKSINSENVQLTSNQSAENVADSMDFEPTVPVTSVTSKSQVSELQGQNIPEHGTPERKSPVESGTSIPVGQMVQTEATIAAPSATSELTHSDTKVQSVQPGVPTVQDQKMEQEAISKNVLPVKETDDAQDDKKQTITQVQESEDANDKAKHPTAVTAIEPMNCQVEAEKEEKKDSSQLSVNGIPMETGLAEAKESTESVKKESQTSVPDDSSHMQSIAKPKAEVGQSAEKTEEGKIAVTTSEEIFTASQSQEAKSAIANIVTSGQETNATAKPLAVSEIKTEDQPTPPVSIPAAHLSSIPRPRHFGPVGTIEEMHRQMFQRPGRPPFPGQVSGRYAGPIQDFRQQSYPPVSQPPGQQRQPQPAHFHESQLRFMQQMYQHQLVQGQRPQAAHQSIQQFPPGQHPYPSPHSFRGPMPGQPGFPPHFYPQHPNMAAAQQQIPISTHAGSLPEQMAVSRSKSISPNGQNLQRLPLPQHPVSAPESGSRSQGSQEQAVGSPATQSSEPDVSVEQAIKGSSPTTTSESTLAHSDPVVTSEVASSQSTSAVPSENAVRHPAPQPTTEHEKKLPTQGPASEIPARQLGPNLPTEFAARFQGPHRYPYPGYPPEHMLRYPYPGMASNPPGRHLGPWSHTEVRVRYPGPGLPPEARPRYPAMPVEPQSRPSGPGMSSETIARHPLLAVTSVSQPGATSESAARQSSPATESENAENSQTISKSETTAERESLAVVKEEPMEFEPSSCMSASKQTALSKSAVERGSAQTSATKSAIGNTESVAVASTTSETASVQIKLEPGSSETTSAGPQTSIASSSTQASGPSVSSAEQQQHMPGLPRPPSGHRQSPGHSQGQGPDSLSQSSAELTLPSVSATFAAAGMMQYGENMHPGLPPYTQGAYRFPHPSSTHGPGFSSVSSIVQSVSSVSFPSLSGINAQHHVSGSIPPAEVALPPSAGVSEPSSSVGSSTSTQTPVHHKVGPHPHPGNVPVHPTISAASEQTTVEGRPPSAGSSVPVSQSPRPGHPYLDAQGAPGGPGMPGPQGPRMPVPPQSATQPGHGPRPRGPRQPRHDMNQVSAASRFPRVPSNLPPHLAGMLNNMRGPVPARHMYPQERHPGMPPMGPMRFPQGQGMMPMGPGGYRMPVSQDGSPVPMTSEGQMQVPMGAARHPGMIPQGMVMRPGMRMVGPGGPMMGPHPMQPPHVGPISPTAHPGAPPHMHPRMIHPTTASGPIMGPPGMPQPSGHPSPKEPQSPTQGLPQRPPTPGSMPSTPSPTSFHPGMMATTSSASMAPGLPGEMQLRHRFPGHRMRMPFDGRMPFDANMAMPPRMPGMEGIQRPPGFPPDGQIPGIPQIRPDTSHSIAGPFDDPNKRMDGMKPGPVPTPPQPGSKSTTPPVGSETNSASTTPSSPGINIKQEQNIDGAFGLDPNLASQNALLKKLLAKSNASAQAAAAAAAAMSGQSTPHSTDQSEDSNDFSNIQLTPEQQRQLELIEKMPLLKETRPGEGPPPGFLTGESNDPDIEAKRLEFERRRKEMEEVRKQKRQGKAEGAPRKRRKKSEIQAQMQAQLQAQLAGQGHPPGLDPMALVTGDKGQQVDIGASPEKKKRQRKTKKEKLLMEEGNLDSVFDIFMQQLKQLPPVPLMEPLVSHMYAICSVPGMSSTTDTEPKGQGIFGKIKLKGEPDYYVDSTAPILPSSSTAPGLSKPRDIAGRRKLISDKSDITDQQRYLMMMDSIMDKTEGQTSVSPFGLGSQLLGMPKGATPTLPPPPRVEPRVNVPKGASDSPESVISSSSPEMGFGEPGKPPDYPMLRPIEPAASDEETRTSPAVPLLQPVPIKVPPFMVKQEGHPPVEIKTEDRKPEGIPIPAEKGKEALDSALSALAGKENIHGGEIDPLTGLIKGARDPRSDQEVSVTLTLSAKAAEDIGGVLSAIADLLKIAAPPTYEVSRSPSPVQQRVVEKHKEESLNVHNLARTKHFQMYCRHCDTAILHAGIQKKKSDLPYLTKEELDSVGDYMRFCSMSCFTNFSITRQMTQRPDPKDLPPSDLKGSLAMALGKDPLLISPRDITPSSSAAATPGSSGTEPMLLGDFTPTKSGPPTPMLTSPTMMRQLSQEKLGKRLKASLMEPPKVQVKKWRGIRYKKFEQTLFPEVSLTQKKDEDESKQWKKLTQAITYLDIEKEDRPLDTRMCEFCKGLGDGPSDGTARLLNMDIDKWAHLNCALWSYEVYETLNGALMNVQQAYERGLKQKCVVCVNMGATLSCFKQRCNNIYHVECAKLVGCVFFEDKTILCPPHSKIPMEQILKSLVVYRRVYINRDEDNQVANMLLQEDGNFTFRLGSIILNNIGQLLPHQIGSGKFNTRDHMYPVGYKATRFYWSMRKLYKRCRYVCSIRDKEGRPEFQVKVIEEGHDDSTLSSNTCKEVWKTVLEPIEKLHRSADLVKVFPNFTSGEEFYGLNDPNIVRLIESLPGTDLMKDYIFKFGRRQLIDLPLTINPTGCARAEPKLRTHFRKPHITLQSSSSHHSLPSSVTGLSGDLNSPYMKHFVHSKSQQYRRLKTEWRNLVYLGRSRIQGLGLFAARDLDQHTMVIEYIGELIRNEVANKREKIYEATNRGVYMFRIDDNTVVDATMSGGPARYINHSCDPNCQAEVVELDQPKIIIITNRRISKGEELNYDYQFDVEDDKNKIPCMCGAHCCRKWMN